MTLVREWIRRCEGQGLAEYTLTLAFIALVAIAGLVFLGGSLTTMLMDEGTKIGNVLP